MAFDASWRMEEILENHFFRWTFLEESCVRRIYRTQSWGAGEGPFLLGESRGRGPLVSKEYGGQDDLYPTHIQAICYLFLRSICYGLAKFAAEFLAFSLQFLATGHSRVGGTVTHRCRI